METQKTHTVLYVLLGTIFALIVGIIGMFGGYYLNKSINSPESQTVADGNIVSEIEEGEGEDENDDAVDDTVTPTEPVEEQIDDVSNEPVTYTTNETGSITWQSPVKIVSLNLLTNYDEKNSKYYLIGKINNGKYIGGQLILINAGLEGMGIMDTFIRIIKTENNIVELSKYSYSYLENRSKEMPDLSIIFDKTYTIKELDAPEKITSKNSRQVLVVAEWVNTFFSDKYLKKAFNDPILGDIYTTKDDLDVQNIVESQKDNSDFERYEMDFLNYGYYLKLIDGTAKVYKYEPDFIKDYNLPELTWEDGTKNEKQYTYTDNGGCGATNYASVMDLSKVKLETDLVQTGTNIKNDPIYEFINEDNPLLQNLYNEKYHANEKIPYEDFVKAHPVFFWIDPFGRLLKFENNEFIPAGECGKPVIYLYPEKTTKVNVKVAPTSGFTYTEPLYPKNEGWTVLADTQSNLTEISSGKVYPYLFWEGRGGMYQPTNKGFIVAKKDVHNFLIEKLAKLGLNEKETADFIEFWEPKMQTSPYYFVTFYGNQTMNQIAPLEITPKPDIIIRILMDFQALEKPIEVEELQIRMPERKGFTVVEWGGVL